MALVFVLWVMTILCAVAIQMRFSTHLRLQTTSYLAQSTKAYYLARAGVARVMADLVSTSENEDLGFDTSMTTTTTTDDSKKYCNVELGEGSYTLYAGTDDNDEPVYGMIDESARINVNTADRSILSNVPGLDPVTARLIERTARRQPFIEMDDLLLIDGIDRTTLYGEDDNDNGILDPNENDGDLSWPPDNEDGTLDRGIAAYLTTWSMSKNVSSDGKQKININTASADTLAKKIPQIDANEAQSIVEYRNKTKFKSIAELLDVELVKAVTQKTGGSSSINKQPNNGAKNGNAPRSSRQSSSGQKNRGANDKNSKNSGNKTKGNSKTRNAKEAESVLNAKSSSSGGKNDSKNSDGKTNKNDKPNGRSGPSRSRQNPGNSSQRRNNGQQSNTNKSKSSKVRYTSTGRKAFDVAALREFADRVTVSDDKILKGVININTASAEVLACLPGISEAIANEIVLTRQDELDGFKSRADLLDVQGISKKDFEKLCPLITVRSDVFSVRSYGVLNSGDVYVCADAVIDRTENKPKIVYWREVE